jgi:catechol 2,3-dioxygenase-like lactoylglutathione lyase family enzyme
MERTDRAFVLAKLCFHLGEFIMPQVRFQTVAWLIAAVSLLMTSAIAAAQEAAFHHVHLNSTDPPATAKWYADNWSGEAKKVGIYSATGFGKVVFIYFKAKPGFPESAGSVVDHIGFSVPNLEAKLKQLKEANVEIVSGIEQEGPIRFAYAKDPWGTLIEILEDPQIQGFHHVHLAAVNPDETLAWYKRAFGGEVGRFAGEVPGIRYGDVWLLVKKVKDAPAPTKGRAIDHISWGFKDLDAECARLKTDGAKFTMEPTRFGAGKIAFVVDPTGVLIELVGPAKPN